ncbi:MAG: hypothetical protein AB1441_04190 [Bacillota bacterium]
MNDRLTIGFFAGLTGGVLMNVINLASYYLGIAELRYLDWAAIVIYGTRPVNLAEAVFALVSQVVFVGMLGVVFAYLITVITSTNILLRGWLFGIAIWFSLYGITLLFHVQETIPVRLDTALTDFVGASVYGLVLALTLGWLGERVRL